MSYLYIIAASEDGPCKIGVSSDPKQRLLALQSGHPHALSIFYRVECNHPYTVESRTHEALKDKNSFGEWFAVSAHDAKQAVSNAIVELCKQHPLSLRELRIKSGFKSITVARHFGFARWAVTNWERGIRRPEKEEILELANLFHCEALVIEAALAHSFCAEQERTA